MLGLRVCAFLSRPSLSSLFSFSSTLLLTLTPKTVTRVHFLHGYLMLSPNYLLHTAPQSHILSILNLPGSSPLVSGATWPLDQCVKNPMPQHLLSWNSLQTNLSKSKGFKVTGAQTFLLKACLGYRLRYFNFYLLSDNLCLNQHFPGSTLHRQEIITLQSIHALSQENACVWGMRVGADSLEQQYSTEYTDTNRYYILPLLLSGPVSAMYYAMA